VLAPPSGMTAPAERVTRRRPHVAIVNPLTACMVVLRQSLNLEHAPGPHQSSPSSPAMLPSSFGRAIRALTAGIRRRAMCAGEIGSLGSGPLNRFFQCDNLFALREARLRIKMRPPPRSAPGRPTAEGAAPRPARLAAREPVLAAQSLGIRETRRRLHARPSAPRRHTFWREGLAPGHPKIQSS